MGQRYEKSKKNVTENKQTLEKLNSDKETLQNEFAPLSNLDGILSILEDETYEAVNDVKTVGIQESNRIESETNTTEKEKQQIISEIQSEISKLNDGLEILNRIAINEFGSHSIDNSRLEYTKQIDGLKALIEELEDSQSHISNSGRALEGAPSVYVSESLESETKTVSSTNRPSHSNNISGGLNYYLSEYPLINGSHSIDEDLKATNPHFSSSDPDSPWNNNCQRCVCAYEARRRGYDVEAQPIPSGTDYLPVMRHPNGWPSVFERAKLIDCSANSGTGAAINIENQMEEWGYNSRAIVRVRWKAEFGGGGHVFIAERTNGITRFIDPQNGETNASSYFNFAYGNDVFCMRIDNIAFSEKIQQCCSSRTA